MTPEQLKDLRRRLMQTLIEHLDEVAFIGKGYDFMAEITKPVSLALHDTMLYWALENGVRYDEDVELLHFGGTIVAKHTMYLDGLRFTGVGEGAISEDKDNAARTAETRAHKRVLDKLLGHYAHATLVWLGQKVSADFRKLDKPVRDKYFAKDTPIWEREKILNEVLMKVIAAAKPLLLERLPQL